MITYRRLHEAWLVYKWPALPGPAPGGAGLQAYVNIRLTWRVANTVFRVRDHVYQEVLS